MKKLLVLSVALALLAACSSSKDEDLSLSAEELYRQGFERLEKTSYKKAAEDFEKVETEHPYSKWAVKAKLMGAYAYYKDEKYDDAVLSLERFIKYHPGNKDAAYAYYMKGLCYYDQISPAEKDQDNTKQAQTAFEQLIALFPDTAYAADAAQKMNLIQDHLAGQEMTIGRYYLKQKNYLSALNRFGTVVEKYQTTPQIEEALYRQIEIYEILGLAEEADKSTAVLKHNYPDGHWTQKALKLIKKED
jgi:outer membrane protein assembly factor BamD